MGKYWNWSKESEEKQKIQFATGIRKMPRRHYPERIILNCEVCGKIFDVPPNRKSTAKYCSRECFNKSKKVILMGEKNPNWKGGKIIIKGYDYILNNGKYIRKHRLYFEKNLGRKLKDDEIIHHIDFDKKNHKITNLFLSNQKEHAKLHKSIEKIIHLLIKKGIITFDNKKKKYILKRGLETILSSGGVVVEPAQNCSQTTEATFDRWW